MNSRELATIIKKHADWLAGREGTRADLCGATLIGANLSEVNLSGANLSGANLSHADLWEANLSGADLSKAILNNASLSKTNLSDADLGSADLSGANLSGANLNYANLTDARLRCANLSGTDLQYANLSGSDLSGVIGLIDAKKFLSQFKTNKEGYLVYKTFGEVYASSSSWVIKPLSEITEVVNPLPTVECGCGINVATINWVVENCTFTVYECLLKFEDLIDCVVPYETKGKFRVGKVTILRALTQEDVIAIKEEEKTRLLTD